MSAYYDIDEVNRSANNSPPGPQVRRVHQFTRHNAEGRRRSGVRHIPHQQPVTVPVDTSPPGGEWVGIEGSRYAIEAMTYLRIGQ